MAHSATTEDAGNPATNASKDNKATETTATKPTINHKTLVVRDARESDASAIAALGLRAAPLGFPNPNAYIEARTQATIEQTWTEFTIKRHLQDSYKTLIVAHDTAAGKILGFAQLCHNSPCPFDPAGYSYVKDPRGLIVMSTPWGCLDMLYVEPDLQGQGLRDHLLEVVCHMAPRGGVTKLWLMMYERNVRARLFYSQRGFMLAGETGWGEEDGLENVLMMAREL